MRGVGAGEGGAAPVELRSASGVLRRRRGTAVVVNVKYSLEL